MENKKSSVLSDGAFGKTFGGLVASHAGGATFPVGWAAPWHALLVGVAIETTSGRECQKGEGNEQCESAHNNCVYTDLTEEIDGATFDHGPCLSTWKDVRDDDFVCDFYDLNLTQCLTICDHGDFYAWREAERGIIS